MNVREGIDIAKMAIACMLLVLVIGAGMSVWYIMSGHSSKLQGNLDKATNSASMERLWELQDDAKSAKADNRPERYPLVTNVANAIAEFNEDSLLYIYVYDANETITNTTGSESGATFTYKDVTLTDMPNKHQSTTPTTDAVKLLLRYSAYRCDFEITEYKYGGLTYTGLKIRVLNKDS